MIDVNSTGNALQIQASGLVILILLIAVGGFLGWRWGMRSFLTITLASIVAYVLFVDGGEQVLAYLNNIYTNIPRIIALLTGSDPTTVAPWPPLTAPVQLPLAVQVLLFLGLILLSIRLNPKRSWYQKEPKQPYAREMGAFTGALTTLIWISAATTFWLTYVQQEGTLGGFIDPFLAILPDVSNIVMPFILLLMVIIVFSLLLKVPNLLKP